MELVIYRDGQAIRKNVEIEIAPTTEGLLIRKRTRGQHPVDQVYGLLDRPSSTDPYIEEIRGR